MFVRAVVMQECYISVLVIQWTFYLVIDRIGQQPNSFFVFLWTKIKHYEYCYSRQWN